MQWVVGHLVDGIRRHRQCELWEAAGDGKPFFMVASRLTKREAVDTAAARARTRPWRRVLVLDRFGAPVYQPVYQ
jgi:hypothetical protein